MPLPTKEDSSAPNPGDRLEQLLAKGATKALVSALDDNQKTQRAASAVLVTACAYVCLASVGYAQAQHANELKMSRASQEVERLKASLQSAKQREQSGFEEQSRAELRVEELDARATLAAKDVTITEKQREVEWKAQQTAQLARKKDLDRQTSAIAAAQKKVDTAQEQVVKARAEVEDFKRKDRESRYSWDRRRADVPADLIQAVGKAEAALGRQEKDLATLRSADRAPEPKPTSAQPQEEPQPVRDPLSQQHQHRAVLKDLADARLDRIRAQGEWQQAQREKETAMAAYTATKAELERLKQEPAPLSLPVIGLGVRPSVFLAAAPGLLFVLLLGVAIRERSIVGVRKRLVVMAAEHGIAPSYLVACVPGIGSPASLWQQVLSAQFPDLAVIATCGLLTLSPEWRAPALGGLVALILAVYRGAILRKLRRAMA